ncbi:hypothetical protein CspeluHIS016_0404180 [Cutaneotrichosporon spelunceum]|uniref:Zn(2)-C6 fungal-type domain-containing protein n=1 Tax=Cutaneotrichosporon spelunceum TaxID=1672016 RepID=A0AAD3TVC3_9TREE|nr:hypothetical protein CspeluHIS016_0404180 [Cutaneotrichosporon spelunceum]
MSAMDPRSHGVHGNNVQFPQKKVPIRRPRKACTICRGLKTRCLPDGDNKDPQACCSRCARLGLACEYSRARRGKKTSDNEHSPPPPSGVSLKESHMQNSLGINFTSPRSKWDLVSTYDNQGSDGRLFASGMLDEKGPVWSTHQPGNGLVPNGDDHSPVLYPASNGSESHSSPLAHYNLAGRTAAGFAEYINPQLQMVDGPQDPFTGQHVEENADGLTPDGFPNGFVTPIEAGFISNTDAVQLVALFMSRIAPSSSLFDPYYHTFERVRQSPVLLTAILSASALFFQPDMAVQLRKLADSYISRKMSSGHYDVTLIQAIAVLICWKHPNDRTTYQKMGMAVRLVHELRLPRASKPSCSLRNRPTEEEDRRKADIERTAFWCSAHDRVISHALQLPTAQPSSAPTAEQVYEWAESHRYLNLPSDDFAAFNAGLWEAHSTFPAHPRLLVEGMTVKYTPEGYAILANRLEQHATRFQNHPMTSQEPFSGLCKLMGDSAVLKMRTLGWMQNLRSGTTSSAVLQLCEEFVGAIKGVDDIFLCSDMVVRQVSAPGILLALARKKFTRDELRRCSSISNQIADIAAELGTHVGAQLNMPHIEDFYRRLVRGFNRFVDGIEVSPAMPLQNFAHNQWQGLSAEFTSAPTAPVPLGSHNGAPPEWAWTNVINNMNPLWATNGLQ